MIVLGASISFLFFFLMILHGINQIIKHNIEVTIKSIYLCVEEKRKQGYSSEILSSHANVPFPSEADVKRQ
jgi:uncharacterized radical SAM superfamily protein